MRLEAVTAEIRPRSDWEAVDLGFALARRSFWRCWLVWWLAVALPTLAAAILLWRHPLWFFTLFWWWRPAASRMVLFELSRRLFGETPSWRQVWREIPRAWTRRFFHRFILARLSHHAPVTMAVEDLEGLRGKLYRQRCRLIFRRGDNAVLQLATFGLLASVWLAVGLFGVAAMFVPEGQNGGWSEAVEIWRAQKSTDPTQVPPLILRAVALCLMLATSLTDVFVTGAGFGLYVNSRTWTEGWDVELAFKRLANRLGKIAAVLALACACGLSPAVRAAERPSPETVIREIKADPAFEIHKEKYRVPKDTPARNWSMPDWWAEFIKGFGLLLLVLVAAALLAGLIWLAVRYRHLFQGRSGGRDALPRGPVARVVMGMAVSPESLPDDVAATAWRWWCEGRRHDALALLYRGAIAGFIARGRVEIAESDTEGDCLRRVNEAGEPTQADYFHSLTGAWIRLAYARQWPADEEVEALCRHWPFVERGAA
jgi:hypothetical protein